MSADFTRPERPRCEVHLRVHAGEPFCAEWEWPQIVEDTEAGRDLAARELCGLPPGEDRYAVPAERGE